MLVVGKYGLGFSSVIDTINKNTTGTSKLQKSPASIMAAYIIEQLDVDMTDPSDKSNWPLYISHMPDGSNVKTDCGAIYDTAGIQEQRSMTGEWSEHPGIQIRIRSRSYEDGYVKIEDIANALDAIAWVDFEIGDLEYRIFNVSRTSPIASLGTEPGTRRRFNFTINFLLTIKELTG